MGSDDCVCGGLLAIVTLDLICEHILWLIIVDSYVTLWLLLLSEWIDLPDVCFVWLLTLLACWHVLPLC